MPLRAEFLISLLSLSRICSAFKTGGGIEESPVACPILHFRIDELRTRRHSQKSSDSSPPLDVRCRGVALYIGIELASTSTRSKRYLCRLALVDMALVDPTWAWRYLMPTKNPRINVALEKPIYSLIERMARERGLSLSW